MTMRFCDTYTSLKIPEANTLPQFLLLLIILSSGKTLSQSYFNVLNISGSNSAGQCIKLDANNDLIIGGNRGDSALVIKCGTNGNVIWTRSFRTNAASPDNILHIEVDPNNNIIGIGNSYGSLTDNMFYFKMDTDGNILWLHQENDPIRLIGYRILPTSVDYYTLSFTTYDTNSSTYSDISMAKVDALNGDLIMLSPRFNSNANIPYIDESMAAVLASDGFIYLTGRNYINGAPQSGMRSFVNKHTSDGSYVQGKYLCWSISDAARIYATDIIESNGGLTQSYIGDNNGISVDFELGIIHTNMDGQVIWSKNYNIVGSSSEVVSKIIKTSYGYALTGYINAQSKDIFIMAVDEDGDVIWCRSFDVDMMNQDYFNPYGLMATNFGDRLFLTGRHGDVSNQHVFLMSFDIDEPIESDCVQSENRDVIQTDNPEAEWDFIHSTVPGTFTINTLPSVSDSPGLMNNCPNFIDSFLGPDTAVCGSFVLDPDLTGQITYLWNNGSSADTLVIDTTGIYWLGVTINCCTFFDSIEITFDSQSLNSFSMILGELTQDSCSYSFDYSTGLNSGDVLWDFDDGISSNALEGVHTWPGPGSYLVTCLLTDNCTISSDTMVLTLEDYDISVLFSYEQVPCTNVPAVFTNYTENAFEYEWFFGDGDSSNLIEPDHVYDSPGMLSVTLIASNSCQSDTLSLPIEIPELPYLSINSSYLLCSGDSIELEAFGMGVEPLIYNWNPGSGTENSLLVSPDFSTSYLVSLVDANSCEVFASTEVIILESTSVVAFGDTTICAGESAVISAISLSEGPFLWSNGFNGPIQTVSPQSTSIYTVTMSNYCGPSSVDSVQIVVVDTSSVNFELLVNGTLVLEDEIVESKLYPTAVQLPLFSQGDGCAWLLNNVPVEQMELTIFNSGEYEFTLLCNDNYCPVQSSAIVVINRPFSFYLPNAISPDWDNLNDVFFGQGQGYIAQKMKIFNRWGEKIYETNSIDAGWNGTYGDTMVEDGVYNYIVDVQDTNLIWHTYIGHVTVLR
jgi:gliding motility-associated-like protein